MKRAIQDVFKEADLDTGLTNVLREQINRILNRREERETPDGILNIYNGGEISWWGKFSDLCSGKDAFSRELIDSFFEDFEEYTEGNRPKPVGTNKGLAHLRCNI